MYIDVTNEEHRNSRSPAVLARMRRVLTSILSARAPGPGAVVEVQQEEDTLMQGNAITRHQPRPATASPGQQLCPGRGQSLAGALGRSPPVIAWHMTRDTQGRSRHNNYSLEQLLASSRSPLAHMTL